MWLDIDTAPLDGTYVLIFCENATIPAVAHYIEIDGETGWAECSDEQIPIWTPLKWQPLPDNPHWGDD